VTEPEYFGHTRPEILAHFPRHSRHVLDIGCGEGALSLGMPDRDQIEVWGIEMDGDAAEKARERLDRVLTTDAATAVAGLPDNYFDCVFCNDVLEHMVDPESLLRMLRPKFAKGGTLISSVPSVRHFWTVYDLVVRGRWDYVDEGVLDRTHLRFYTAATMREMFERCGYEVEHFNGINPTGSLKFKLFNALTFGRLSEMKYLQFVWVLHPTGTGATGQ
jgi:2-polyprenyl-3-methyl-5-hydroxy-6-metoxy-1,4-benzoquinol methylase